MPEPTAVDTDDRVEYPRWVLVWFALDGVLTLFPPIHWAVGGTGRAVAGIPAALVYFAATAVFVAASIVAAYLAEARRGNFDGEAPGGDTPC